MHNILNFRLVRANSLAGYPGKIEAKWGRAGDVALQIGVSSLTVARSDGSSKNETNRRTRG
jgi:hypothetical protein